MASSSSTANSKVGPIINFRESTKLSSNFFPTAKYRKGINSAAHEFFARPSPNGPPPNATTNISVNALTRNLGHVSIGAKAPRTKDLVPPPPAKAFTDPFGVKPTPAGNISSVMSNNRSMTPSQLFASSAARQATALVVPKKGGKRRSTRRRRSKATKKRRSK